MEFILCIMCRQISVNQQVLINIPYAYKFSHDFSCLRILRINWQSRKYKRENVYAYSTSLLLQAAIREIKIVKIVRCGAFVKYMSRENLYAYGNKERYFLFTSYTHIMMLNYNKCV